MKLGKDGTWDATNNAPRIRITLLANVNTIDRGVTIIVEDNGPGINLQERNLIVERGFRGKDAKKKCEGSGIGLDYSRSMIKMMGGELSSIENTDKKPRRAHY